MQGRLNHAAALNLATQIQEEQKQEKRRVAIRTDRGSQEVQLTIFPRDGEHPARISSDKGSPYFSGICQGQDEKYALFRIPYN
jgi:hypothetical protein